jgi:RNA polymerase sigma-70 factor (ECF subfamily)
VTERDAAVVAALLAGDEDTFSALVERLHPRILRITRRFVASAAAAEDVAQDTWQAVLEGLSAFAGRAALDTWILQIAINRAKSRAVRDARLRPLAGEGPDAAAPADERFSWLGIWKQPPRPSPADASPETAAANRELVRLLAVALEALPEQQRLVVILRDVELLSAAEVCAVLELSEQNQRVLLHRGRTRLRAALEGAVAGDPSTVATVAAPAPTARRYSAAS